MPRLFVTATRAGGAAFEALRPRTAHRFGVLPVLVLDTDAAEAGALRATPGLHVYGSDYDSYLPILRHLDRLCSARLPAPVYNLSISHGAGPLDVMEPVTLGTWMAARAGVVGVLAAGNDGPAEDSLSRWARAPWVIAVGAATEGGAAILPFSGIGRPGEAGPHVVANGGAVVPLGSHGVRTHGTAVALIVSGKDGSGRAEGGYVDTLIEGTSFAAPRVARICALLRVLVAVHGGLADSVARRLPRRVAAADYMRACDDLAGEDRLDRPDLPMLHGLAMAELRPLLDLLKWSAMTGAPGADPLAAPSPDEPEPVAALRRMLAAMARPMPGFAPHQVGHGFVDEAVATGWLLSLRPAEWTRLTRGAVPEALERILADHPPLFGATLLDELRSRLDAHPLADAPVL